MTREVYSKTIINDDGTVAVVDATSEVFSLKEKLAMIHNDDRLLSVEEVKQIMSFNTKEAVYNKISQGYFPPNTYLKKKGFPVRFRKKALYKFLGLSYE